MAIREAFIRNVFFLANVFVFQKGFVEIYACTSTLMAWTGGAGGGETCTCEESRTIFLKPPQSFLVFAIENV